jgi:hypothetical protein
LHIGVRRAASTTVAGAVVLIASFAGAAASSAAPVKNTHFPISYMAVKDAHGSRGHGGGGASNLIDNGGKILPISNTYALYWGTSSSWASDVQSGLGTFFGGLNNTSFLKTGLQYMRGAGISTAYQGQTSDTSAPPTANVQPSTLGTEIQKIYGSNLDPNGIYFVFTSNFPSGTNFCAWHSYATIGTQRIAVAYMPNTSGVSGCDPGNLYGVSGSEGLRSLANVTSHEYMEAITDANPGSGTYGWIDSAGSEIGDKCAWIFGSAVTLNNGSTWQLQKEWSNAVTGCVQTS